MTEKEEINTCPKCGASILVNSMFSVVTCAYCQSKFSLQQASPKASAPTAVQPISTKPKQRHPLFKRFYIAMCLSILCTFLLCYFTVRAEHASNESTEYAFCVVGMLLSLIGSPGFIVYAIIVLVQIGLNPVKDES